MLFSFFIDIKYTYLLLFVLTDASFLLSLERAALKVSNFSSNLSTIEFLLKIEHNLVYCWPNGPASETCIYIEPLSQSNFCVRNKFQLPILVFFERLTSSGGGKVLTSLPLIWKYPQDTVADGTTPSGQRYCFMVLLAWLQECFWNIWLFNSYILKHTWIFGRTICQTRVSHHSIPCLHSWTFLRICYTMSSYL